ncbi:MAG TPA: OFA family MFS transporter [Symbiobacteriaceae bacterium]
MRQKGWVVTAAGTGINLALGVLYAWSVFKGSIIAELHVTDFQASLPYAVASGMFALMMVPAGRMQDKLGPRLVLTLGGALTGLGLILSYFAHSITMLVLTFGIVAGTGIGLGFSATIPAAVKWFPPQKKGTIIGIVVSGFGIASVYISPLAKSLLAGYGLNMSFLILGITFLVLIIGLAQLVTNPAKGFVPVGTPASAAYPAESSGSRGDYEWFEIIRTSQFYLLWLMYAAGATGGLMIIGHLATYADSIGIGGGFVLVAILAACNAGGRVSAGLISDRIGRTRTMLLVFLVHAAGLLILPRLTSFVLLSAGTGVMGFCYGSYSTLFPSTTYDYFGTKHGGVNYGLVFTAWGVGGVFGAPLAGYIKDVTGAYNLAFYIAAALILLAAGLTFVTKPPKAR